MGDISVETLGSKIRFSNILETFPPPPFPSNNVDFSFLSQHRPQGLHNIELGGQGYHRINARYK